MPTRKNLITGTRYLNVTGMLPFEDMVADYVKETSNHVMYRVTPIFEGNNLVAKGVKMEGYSVEDKGEGISFNVFCYNVQPGVTIDYATGDSIGNGKVESSSDSKKSTSTGSSKEEYKQFISYYRIYSQYEYSQIPHSILQKCKTDEQF